MSHRTLRTQSGLVVAAFLFLAVGCATPPQTADGLREFVRKAPFHSVETFEVARPFQDVSAALRKKSAECLNARVEITSNRGTFHNDYKPTFISGPNRAELHIQLKRSGVVEVGSGPDGYYRVVADAAPVAANRTKIDLYVRSIDDNLLRDTVRHWAQGTNMGCPDLTKR